jgi:AraC-like DNA-binding protein
LKRLSLPPLAFGNENAVEHHSAKDFGTIIESVFPGLDAYESIESKFFLSRTSRIDLGDSVVVSAAISPTHVERSRNESLIFMLPFAGQPDSYCEIQGNRVNWGMGLSGIFLPKTDYRTVGRGGFRTHLMWQLDSDRLIDTARVMFGRGELDLRLDRMRALPTAVAGRKTLDMFTSYLPLLRFYQFQPEVLKSLGVDDFLYRSSVALLLPEEFEKFGGEPPETGRLARHRVVRSLADQVVADLSASYSLTDLERISGLSARTLQTAFLECFNMSPTAWVKEQRLQRARELFRLRPDITVQAVASKTGFRSQATFFTAYRIRFGETPKAKRSDV